MPAVPHILFGALFTIAVSVSLGTLLFDLLKLRMYRNEYFLLGFVTGASCLSTIVFLAAAAHITHKGVFFALGFIPIGAASWCRRRQRTAKLPVLPPLPRLWKILFAVAFAVFTVLYFTNAMAPEMSPDGSGYHLGLVDRYYRAHGFDPGPNTLYSSLPQGTEMLFLFAYTFGKHSAAAMVHYAFLIALAFLILSWGRRYGYPGVGVTAALLVYASPIVGVDGVSAYNDVAAACTVFALFYVLQLWKADRAAGWLIATGLLAGFCFAVKYTVALAIPYALVYVAWRTRKVRPVAIVAACASIMVVPWIAKDWILVGNPVAPFFNVLFPNPNIHIEFECLYRENMRHFGSLPGVWATIFDLTVRGVALGGLLGPVFLLAPIALLALRRAPGRELLATFAIFFLPYFANHGTRFTIPSLPFLSIAMALALVDAPVVLAAIVVLHLVISWPSVLGTYNTSGAWRLHTIPVEAALRLIPEDTWLAGHSATYIAARMVERDVPRGERVFAINGTAEAYTTHDIMVRFQSAQAETLGEILFAGMNPLGQPTHIEDFHFPPRKLERLRAVETAAGGELWNISEFRLYNGGAELKRDSSWRLTASPDPWEVQFAFDNSPITRWFSWQTISPGMFVEVDLGAPRMVDRVRLECAIDQPNARVKLEGMAGGRWTTLSNRPKELDLAPLKGMRLAATEALKRHGIHYMLVAPYDYGAGDYRANADQWGFTLIEEQADMRLYRLDGAK